jgi:tetratricopeptide (TPR) repeat protein
MTFLLKKALAGTFILLFFSTFQLSAADANDCEAKARREYWRAKAAQAKSPEDATANWEFASACFEAGEFATNSNERAELAEQGIAVSRKLIERDPNLARAHYYLGMNLGQLARTRGLSALKLVSEMESVFKRARELDEKLDHGGPNRNLGLLYRDAPHIASIGSRSKAQKYLPRAVEVAPDFPENRLVLIESYLRWNDRNGAKRELKALEELWPRALKTFSGPEWECTWPDWKKRFGQVKRKIEEPSRAIESPRSRD